MIPFPNSRVSNWNKLISSLLVLFPRSLPVVFLLSLPLPLMILLPFPCGDEETERHARRSRQSVSWMEPSQHSGPYCSLPAGFDHTKTWYRLILSEEEKISPITHRGILGACLRGYSGPYFGSTSRADSNSSALVGCKLVS